VFFFVFLVVLFFTTKDTMGRNTKGTSGDSNIVIHTKKTVPNIRDGSQTKSGSFLSINFIVYN